MARSGFKLQQKGQREIIDFHAAHKIYRNNNNEWERVQNDPFPGIWKNSYYFLASPA